MRYLEDYEAVNRGFKVQGLTRNNRSENLISTIYLSKGKAELTEREV